MAHTTHATLITVGQLAQRVGLRTSALRYYEDQGLLLPTAHSESGYRLYDAAAEETLRFILRAQRLGFALADISVLLAARNAGSVGDDVLLRLTEARYVAIERKLTPLLVARHELAHLLHDLHSSERPRLAHLLDEVCADALRQPATTTLDRLLTLIGCELQSDAGQAALAQLRGVHSHIWQEDDAYHILVVSDDPTVATALEQLTHFEAECALHAATIIRELRHTDEGPLLVARGDDAFLYARLFMALEDEGTGDRE